MGLQVPWRDRAAPVRTDRRTQGCSETGLRTPQRIARVGSVSGILPYARTDEEVVPDDDFVIGGNALSVKDFGTIRSLLDTIATTLRQ